jgi:hypothetical protein
MPQNRVWNGGYSAVDRRGRLLPWLDWRFSLVLPLAVVLLIATFVYQTVNRQEILEITVTDQTTGERIEGARVSVGGLDYLAGDDGSVRIERPEKEVTIRVQAEGYQAVSGPFTSASGSTQQVTLKPAVIGGMIGDAQTGQPLSDVKISLVDQHGSVLASNVTDETGTYHFADVPHHASLVVDAGAYGSLEKPISSLPSMDMFLEISRATGRVLNASGEPVQGAIVQFEDATAITSGDGTFTLEGVGNGAEVNISAAGYADAIAVVDQGSVADVALDPVTIKATYADLNLLADPDGIDRHIEIANTTEINAIVIDIKQDTIYYDSQVEFFLDAGTVRPVYDVAELLRKLKANNIYAIARLVVFQDPLVAEARPDLAVMDSVTGDLWRNEIGIAWVSAFNQELWDANIELAVEALDLGFDEIQYDYVRFPSDGDLSTAEFGRDYTAEARQTAITSFMKASYETIHAKGGKLAADLFGYVTIVDDEQYIGQQFSELEPYLDYVCMMIYPSHFSEGNIASAAGHPNDFPYETILESLERAEQNVPGSAAKFRPWLQDFSYWGMREYTAEDVRLQIDAAEDFGATGWMLWGDPYNVTVEALAPEDV